MKTRIIVMLFALACTFMASPVFAASRYWVGGTASWDGTAGTKWALTSGGVGGQAVPTNADDCFFDAQSSTTTPTVTVVTATANCNNIDFTGFTGTLAGSTAMNVAGNFTWGSGMTRTYTGAIIFNGTAATSTITSNSISFGSAITINGVGGAWKFGDNFNSTATFTLTNGSVDTNWKDATTSTFSSSNSNVRQLYLRGSLWSTTGTGNAWTILNSANISFDAGTSTVRVVTTGAAGRNFQNGFSPNILTYYNLWYSGTGTATYQPTCQCANEIRVDPGVKFNFQQGFFAQADKLNVSGNPTTQAQFVGLISGNQISGITLTSPSSIDYINLTGLQVFPSGYLSVGCHSYVGLNVTGVNAQHCNHFSVSGGATRIRGGHTVVR